MSGGRGERRAGRAGAAERTSPGRVIRPGLVAYLACQLQPLVEPQPSQT